MKSLPVQSDNFRYIEKSFKEWLDILGYAPTTIHALPIHARGLFNWLETQKDITHITHLTTPLIKEYYDVLKNNSKTRRGSGFTSNYLNKHLQALYKLSEYLRKSGRLELPYLGLQREEVNGNIRHILSIAQIKKLYQATELHPPSLKWESIAGRDKAMLTVFYGCGLRRNEGYYLDLSDINFDRQVLHVRRGKNYKERFVPFNKKNALILESYIYDHRPYFLGEKEADALFISAKRNRMHPQSMALRIKLLQQRTDDIELQQMEISLHALRHSIATHLLQQGMSLENISRFLGHSSLESTQIYTHLIDKENGKL